MKKKVLIFSGATCAAAQIYFCLKDSLRYQPILGSSCPGHGDYITSEAINNLPYIQDNDFADRMNEFMEKEGIDFIIPTHDTIADVLTGYGDRIHGVVVCSPHKTAHICRYKSKTYQALGDASFLPKLYRWEDKDISYPIFAKNDIGQGGQDTCLVQSDRELLDLRNSKIDYVLCEYLPGEEITVDCFTDRHGKLCFLQPRTRGRLLDGISAHSETLELSNEIREIAAGISKGMEFRGYWFFQCKKSSCGNFKLMEVSVRFAGTFSVSKNLDVNLPLLAVTDFDGIDIEIIPNRYGISADKNYINRYRLDLEYDRVYLDFDDTLVFHREKYHTAMMMFVYQCLNENKEIILITKHSFDIYETMSRLKLNRELFDQVIQVQANEEKYLYMDQLKPSIFIDNSYRERSLVKKKLGMPAFDTCNVECLLKDRN